MKKSVEFHEDHRSFQMSRTKRTHKQPLFVRLLKKTGLVKNRAQANIALLVIALLFFAAAGLLYFNSTRPEPGEQIYREDIPPEMREQIPPEKLDDIPSRN